MKAKAITKMLWLQGSGCGGCTMAVLERGSSGWFDELRRFGITLLWHPVLSAESAAEAVAVLEAVRDGTLALDLLVVEGAVARGPDNSGRFHRFAGATMLSWIEALAPRARAVVALGSCAAYGGVPAAGSNPTDVVGLQFEGSARGGALGADFRTKSGHPVVNIAGCAPHPGWIMETLLALIGGDLGSDDLDAYGRPKFIADHLAHHGCARNEFYEFKASAETLSQRGCMMEHLGCKATQAVGDCNQRSWNGGGSCIKGGFACIACTSPGFENAQNFLTTLKLGGIPVGLPTDMPKAWFVALAALSKSATPKRVRINATADHVVVPPTRRAP